jgi:hypothetical protein
LFPKEEPFETSRIFQKRAPPYPENILSELGENDNTFMFDEPKGFLESGMAEVKIQQLSILEGIDGSDSSENRCNLIESDQGVERDETDIEDREEAHELRMSVAIVKHNRATGVRFSGPMAPRNK